MLNIQKIKHLSKLFDTSVNHLTEVIDNIEDYYDELILYNPAKPNKSRKVVSVRNPARNFQNKLLQRLLNKKLTPSVYSHGGVKKRHIKTNIEPHLHSAFAFKTDISDFYRSIHHCRIYRMFQEKFGCSPDVSRICTKLCTHNYHLALGLITSPILANQLLYRFDARLGAACQKADLVYTRFVDDITISGSYNLQHSGIKNLIQKILTQEGLSINEDKQFFGEIGKSMSITNIRIIKGHYDVRKEYAKELERQLNDAWCLANGEPFAGPYYTKQQILGRIHYVSWINPRRRYQLLKKFTSISWSKHYRTSLDLGLVALKKTVRKLESAAV